MNENEPSRRPCITASMITALAAGVVSLSALTVSIYEAYLMRQQQAAAVLPIMDFWAAYESNDGYSLHLANKGLGPAFVKSIDVRVDGTSQEHWIAVMEALIGRPVAHSEAAIIGSVLSPGESGTLLAINDPDNGPEVWKNANRVALEVCYCSVFENCWNTTISNLNIGTPTSSEVSSCPSGDGVFF